MYSRRKLESSMSGFSCAIPPLHAEISHCVHVPSEFRNAPSPEEYIRTVKCFSLWEFIHFFLFLKLFCWSNGVSVNSNEYITFQLQRITWALNVQNPHCTSCPCGKAPGFQAVWWEGLGKAQIAAQQKVSDCASRIWTEFFWLPCAHPANKLASAL